MNLYQRYTEILLANYQTITTSNFLEFDKLTSTHFCYYIILLINCAPNIFVHKWFTRLKTILPVLIHLSQWGFVKGLDEHRDYAVTSVSGVGQHSLQGKSLSGEPKVIWLTLTHSRYSFNYTQPCFVPHLTLKASLWKYSDTRIMMFPFLLDAKQYSYFCNLLTCIESNQISQVLSLGFYNFHRWWTG